MLNTFILGLIGLAVILVSAAIFGAIRRIYGRTIENTEQEKIAVKYKSYDAEQIRKAQENKAEQKRKIERANMLTREENNKR